MKKGLRKAVFAAAILSAFTVGSVVDGRVMEKHEVLQAGNDNPVDPFPPRPKPKWIIWLDNVKEIVYG